MSKLAAFFVIFIVGSTAINSANAQDKPAEPPFHPYGTFTGQFFSDYWYQIGADTAASRGSQYYSGNKKFAQAFDIRRVYLGYEYNFTKEITSQLLLSHENGANATATLVNAEKVTTTIDSATGFVKTVTLTPSPTAGIPTNSSGDIVLDGNRGLYIKAANLRFKGWVPNATVIFGEKGTYAFALPEAMWSYRSIEKTVMDARGMAQSNDLGIALAGTADKD